MRKNIKCGITLLLLAAAAGCGNTQTAEQQKELAKVTLTISPVSYTHLTLPTIA